MIGTTFKAHSGNVHEFTVIFSHKLFSDTWKCYPTSKLPTEEIKESLVQYFSTDFIKQNEIYGD
jgi:hypothetical protein